MWQETRRIFLEAAGNVLHAAARLLPSVLAMLLFFALAAALAFAIRWGVARACERLALDRRLREWGVAPPGADERSGPSRLLARASFWAVLVIGVFLGLSVLDTAATSAVSMRFLAWAPRALVALVIVAVGLALARVVERNVLIGAVNMGLQSARLVALGARWLVVVLASAIALEHARVGATAVTVAFAIVFGGIVLALSLAVGLGAKDLVARSLQRRFPEERRPDEDEGARDKIHHL